VLSGQAHATVLVRPDGSSPHTFTVGIRLGSEENPVAADTVQIPANPGQIAQADVTAPTSSGDGSVDCQILSIVDEHGQTPISGEPLPAPPDTHPMTPAPGQGGSGPPVMSVPPTQVTPTNGPS
jgi:hypothetical protein